MNAELKKTPLNRWHHENGGKLVGFAGWELPVRFSGVVEEHVAVRQQAGIFDVSHMGEVFVTGPEAEQALNYLTCNNVAALVDGKAQYSALLNPRGGVIDDIIVYRINRERFLLCVNAGNAERDFEWLISQNRFDALIENQSASFGQIALQGPAAQSIFAELLSHRRSTPALAAELKYFHFAQVDLDGIEVYAARTGYTGEDGFEFFVPAPQTETVWRELMECGAAAGLVPVGLGARDSLRLEACYPLHGHELSEEISALEAGLAWIVKFKKGDFIGRAELLRAQEQGLPRRLAGFILADKGIAREGMELFNPSGAKCGWVTSGTKTPTVNQALGLGFVDAASAEVGSEIFVEVRGRRLAGRIVRTPFYTRAK